MVFFWEKYEIRDLYAQELGAYRRYSSVAKEFSQKSDIYFQMFGQQMVVKFNEIPSKGSVDGDTIPYSGWFYPEKSGGTGFGSPSALALFDKAFNGGASKAQTWEKENHSRGANEPDANWAGHCNGWAASAVRHAEPKRAVVRNGVRFETWHIKALLSEINMSSIQYFLAGERCDESVIPPRLQNASSLSPCDDVNPGMLHIIIGNWIGRQKQALAVDMSENREIWNYPLYAYEVLSVPDINRRLTREQAAAMVGSAQFLTPQAVDFRQVRMQLTYADALMQGESRSPAPNRKPAIRYLDYILELDAQGLIVGGEWIGENKKKHPDFIWVPFEPLTSQGFRNQANPHVGIKEVLSLWAESINADPNNPPVRNLLPPWRGKWGQYPHVSFMVNGNPIGTSTNPAVTKLTILRREKFRSPQSKVQIQTGGSKSLLVEYEFKGDEAEHIVELPLGIGAHLLSIKWSNASQSIPADLQTQELVLHVM